MLRLDGSLVMIVGVVLAAACGKSIVGSGHLVTEEHDVGGFDGIAVSHAFEVSVEIGEEPSVVITTDDNLLEHIDLRVEGQRLHLGLEGVSSVRRATLEATITVPAALRELRASGASNVHVTGTLTSPVLELGASGASRVNVMVEVETLHVRAAGASSVVAAGRAGDVDLRASGASELSLEGLEAAAIQAHLSGASKAQVTARESLDADLSGASSLGYGGDPERVTESTAGASTLSRR
jgi:hypothetical protein